MIAGRGDHSSSHGLDLRQPDLRNPSVRTGQVHSSLLLCPKTLTTAAATSLVATATLRGVIWHEGQWFLFQRKHLAAGEYSAPTGRPSVGGSAVVRIPTSGFRQKGTPVARNGLGDSMGHPRSDECFCDVSHLHDVSSRSNPMSTATRGGGPGCDVFTVSPSSSGLCGFFCWWDSCGCGRASAWVTKLWTFRCYRRRVSIRGRNRFTHRRSAKLWVPKLSFPQITADQSDRSVALFVGSMSPPP